MNKYYTYVFRPSYSTRINGELKFFGCDDVESNYGCEHKCIFRTKNRDDYIIEEYNMIEGNPYKEYMAVEEGKKYYYMTTGIHGSHTGMFNNMVSYLISEDEWKRFVKEYNN